MPWRDEIARHAAVLETVTEAAERCAADGRHETACALVQSAAGIVALRHPGRFADARLEAVLARVAGSALPDVERGPGGGGVLHVLSNALEVGGHTRLAWRWMERDTGRRHSFVVTRPAGPAPDALVSAARATGGREIVVPGFEAGLLATAAALRAVAGAFDEIVLHVQPNDPLPSLAWTGVADRPPILFCNHADHCFWLGRDCTDVVVGHRPVAASLAAERRGIPAARTATLALPLDDVAVTSPSSRSEARARIGIPAAARVLLTIGSSYKFEGGERHLLDALDPVLAADPATVLIAVGPAPEGRWAQAATATAGRVLATGMLPDVGDLLAAADVFVESYPCSSGTAAVEAAQRGLPVVAWAPDAVEAALLGSAGAAAGLWPVATTAQELAELIETASGDVPGLDAHHDPERWRDALADARAVAGALGPVARGELARPSDGVDETDRVLHELHARTGHCQPLEVVDTWVAQAQALAAWPALEACFVPSLVGRTTHLEITRCFESALVHPAAGEEASAVEALRVLVVSRLAATGVIALDPDRVDEALPALEAALAAGAEIDLDVTPTAAPGALAGPGTLVVRTPGDGLDAAAGAAEVEASALACAPAPA
jgi:hypothetical protein